MNNNRGERIVWKTAQNVQRAWGKLHYGRVVESGLPSSCYDKPAVCYARVKTDISDNHNGDERIDELEHATPPFGPKGRHRHEVEARLCSLLAQD